MNCTPRELDTCREEKMGCEGCYYDDSEVIKAKERCNELIKVEHANWIGISNQKAIGTVLNYIDKLETRIKDLQQINEEHKKLNGELRKENLKLQKGERIRELEYALLDMILQFADENKDELNTMGLSSLENAFSTMNLDYVVKTDEVVNMLKKVEGD